MKAMTRHKGQSTFELVAVVEVCGNTGYNWFDLPT